MTAAARHPKSERAAAAGVLLTATAVALWILSQRRPEVPLIAPRIEMEEPAQAAPPQSAPAKPASAGALAFEIVELPPMREPARTAPPPIVQHVEPPRPVPLQPEVPKSIVPLQPEEPPVARPVEVAQVMPVIPLRPDEPQASAIVPLKPEPERVRAQEPPKPIAPLPRERPPLTPLVPEPEPREAARAPERPITPLAPEPERPKVVKQEEPQPVLKPLPPMREARTAAPVPRPRVVTPPSAPAPAPSAKVITGEAAGEGRVLLRMFEQGSGPGIEIRWPADAGERDRLYGIFMRCFGMRIGIVDDSGRLYLPEGPPNQPTQLNMDRYSGFVRRPEGQIAADEQSEIARVRRYHQSASGAPARLFPRNVDAFLIGGLRQAVGDGYLKTRSIRAAYRLEGDRVVVDAIVADGHPISGAIDLSSGRSCH